MQPIDRDSYRNREARKTRLGFIIHHSSFIIRMLSGIHVVCFFTSYAIALVLEISRLFFRMPVRLIVMIGFAALGLVVHSAYLWHRARTGSMPVSSRRAR